MTWWEWALVVILGLLGATAVHDLLQRRHAILRNFPVVGHLRFLLEGIGPELRQYIVTDNDSEKPFSRDERRWVYNAAARADTNFGFGTDNDLERSPNYLIIKHVTFPLPEPPMAPPETRNRAAQYPIPCAKVLGAPRQRPKAFRMPSVV